MLPLPPVGDRCRALLCSGSGVTAGRSCGGVPAELHLVLLAVVFVDAPVLPAGSLRDAVHVVGAADASAAVARWPSCGGGHLSRVRRGAVIPQEPRLAAVVGRCSEPTVGDRPLRPYTRKNPFATFPWARHLHTR